MSHHDNTACLLDIKQAALSIASFIEGMDEVAFYTDKKTQAAVQHQIMIIGEAAKRLSRNFRDENAHIPWGAIARMRDRLIHGGAGPGATYQSLGRHRAHARPSYSRLFDC